MCIYFVISNKTLNEWTWRVVNDDGAAVARSAKIFPTRYECIDDAEAFRDKLGEAAFYDFAGVPIDKMHLKKGTFPPVKPLIRVQAD
ncbi:hypothetical protein [Enterobacter cloacae]|uniref:hypothetical protein n=1 Tax=Enterobacter cloacae TaxID=550 RepID=UPI00056F5D9D|nr:hypothetical protein [Enterobacter cloacae]